MSVDVAAVADALDRLPLGAFRARAMGRDWLATRSLHAGGASEKLVARALDGSDHVSLNLYRLASGPRLKPCEMPAAKVAAWILTACVQDRGETARAARSQDGEGGAAPSACGLTPEVLDRQRKGRGGRRR